MMMMVFPLTDTSWFWTNKRNFFLVIKRMEFFVDYYNVNLNI